MKLMEELVRFYEHFGLQTNAGDHPDHVSAELEFMHYLAFKETAAIAHQQDVPDLRRAQRDFLERHLCRWLPRLSRRIASAAGAPAFYTGVAALADGFARADLGYLRG
jgi:DMSO reductase family type II enzyme chaperone